MAKFDANVPTPKLDAIADRMAEILKAAPATIGAMAMAIEASPRTVESILRRPCDRHGRRFEITGKAGKAHLYRLRSGGNQDPKPEGGPRT